MTRSRTVTLEPLTPYEAKQAALVKVLARKRPPQYGEMPDGRGGVIRWQLDIGGTFPDPEDLGQWVDMRVARCATGTGVADTLIRVFEALRGGVAAVPDAARIAAGLDAWGQFGCWMAIQAAPTGPGEIGPVKTALTREWRRQALQDVPPPAAPFGADPMDRNSPRPRQIKYRHELGHNAGLTV